MGNCSSKTANCTVSNQPISADPDVAGIGVLVAFVFSAFLVLIAVFVGYLSDSLPAQTLTQLDILVHARLKALLSRLRKSVKGLWGYSLDDMSITPGKADSEAQKKNRETLQRFMLALSDQQLVTGLAIMIAGYARRCSMSIYHFNIVSSLAWFSSASHLATLGALRGYFVNHTSMRNWRVTGMVVLLGLLLCAQLILFSRHDSSIPVQCALESLSPSSDYADVILLMTTVGFLIDVYVQRIVPLFFADPDWSLIDGIVLVLVKILASRSKRSADVMEGSISSLDVIERGKVIRAKREAVRYRRYEDIVKRNRQSYLKTCGSTLIFMVTELNFAYLSQITTVVFDFVYGVVQIRVLRDDVPVQGISGDQNSMGFGQLVPLLFLVLPCLTMFEVYCGE